MVWAMLTAHVQTNEVSVDKVWACYIVPGRGKLGLLVTFAIGLVILMPIALLLSIMEEHARLNVFKCIEEEEDYERRERNDH